MFRQPQKVGLGTATAPGRQQHPVATPFRWSSFDGLHCLEKGARHENHAATTAKRRVIHLPVCPHAPVAKVMGCNLDQFPLQGTPQDAKGQSSPHQVRENGDDVDVQHA